MLLHICDLNYRILSHHLYISKNKNKNTAPVNDPTGSILTHFMENDLMIIQETIITTWCVLNAVTNNSNSTNNIRILVDATSKIFFILVIKFFGEPLYMSTTILVEFYKTFEKKLSFSLPTSLEFLYTRLVKKDINLSCTLLCCIISPKFLGSTMN